MRTWLIILIATIRIEASSLYLSASSEFSILTPVTVQDGPVTISIWFNLTTAGNDILLALNASTTERYEVGVLTSTNVYIRSINTAGSAGTATATQADTGLQLGQWANVVGTFASDSLRTIYFNGVAKATNTTARTVTNANLDRVYLSARMDGGSVAGFLDGMLASAAIWTNAVLSQSEITSLSQGVSPSLIRPQNLMTYAPLVDGGSLYTFNACGARFAMSNTPTAGTSHPKIEGP